MSALFPKLSLLAASCWVLVWFSNNAAGASHRHPHKMKDLKHVEPAQRNYIESAETGIWSCSVKLKAHDFPELSAVTNVQDFTVFAFFKYFHNKKTNKVYLKGFTVTDVRPPSSVTGNAPDASILLDVKMVMLFTDLGMQPTSIDQSASQWPINFKVKFAMSSSTISTPPGGIWAKFSVPRNASHEYKLVFQGGGPGKEVDYKPLQQLDLLSPEDIDTDLIRQDARHVPNKAIVVLYMPLYELNLGMSALLERHIQHHAKLGFTRHMIYVRPRDIPALSVLPEVVQRVKEGRLVLVQWDSPVTREDYAYWDQRIVYTHAAVAFTGHDILMGMYDIDEYLVSPRPELGDVFSMVRACAPDNRINMRITRFHVIAKEWPVREKEELPLWLRRDEAQHPLLKYSLINMRFPPAVKTLVNPNFIDLFYIHTATHYQPFNLTIVNATCMYLAHVRNLFRPREVEPEKLSTRYFEDAAWVDILQRLHGDKQAQQGQSQQGQQKAGQQGQGKASNQSGQQSQGQQGQQGQSKASDQSVQPKLTEAGATASPSTRREYLKMLRNRRGAAKRAASAP